MVTRTLFDLRKQLLLFDSLNYNLFSAFDISKYAPEVIFFNIFSNPQILFFVLFIIILVLYMVFAKQKVKENANVNLSLILFLILYMFLFAFWWVIAFVYHLFNRSVEWR